MSYDLDDVIEHYGVKGMKWGVRKKVGSAFDKTTKAIGKQVKKRREKQDAYHDKKMKSSKIYKLVYNNTPPTLPRVKGRDRKRQKSARATYRAMKVNLAGVVLGAAGLAVLSPQAQKAISTASKFVISGDAQRLGKNVLNAVTGNPLRYVNAENMKNIVVDSGALGMSINLDDSIEHFGVKGMKWGVRKKPEKKKLVVGFTENSRKKDRGSSYIAPGLGGLALHLATRYMENKRLNEAISKSMNTPIKDIDKKSLKTARNAMKHFTDLRMGFEGEDKEYYIDG